MSQQQIEAILAEAHRYLKVREVPYASNRAVQIDYWLTELGVPLALPWCAAFVWNVGRQALGSSAWRLPRTAGCQSLHDWGKSQNLLQTSPLVGDIFLLWEAGLKPARFGHTGFVTAIDAEGVHTIEGNTNPGGSRDGVGVFERVRKFGSLDRFLRWSVNP